jgi:hypothetical protein
MEPSLMVIRSVIVATVSLSWELGLSGAGRIPANSLSDADKNVSQIAYNSFKINKSNPKIRTGLSASQKNSASAPHPTQPSPALQLIPHI